MMIAHNSTSSFGCRTLLTNNKNKTKAVEKMISGYRINRAGDDAAGLGISEGMRSKIAGLNQGSINTQDGISIIQTIEGATQEIEDVLNRMKELSVQSSNGTNDDSERKLIEKEVVQLKKEIDRIADKTEFNGKKLINGELSGNNALIMQIGDKQEDFIKIDNVDSMKCDSLGIDGLSVETQADAQNAISMIDDAINKVSEERVKLGAAYNKLDFLYKSTDNTSENMTASESRLRDADIPSLAMENVKDDILLKSTEAIIIQANSDPKYVLQLLGN